MYNVFKFETKPFNITSCIIHVAFDQGKRDRKRDKADICNVVGAKIIAKLLNITLFTCM